MKFKFWKWKIDIKIKKLNADEKIGYLANEIIKEMIASGRKVESCNSKGHGYVPIWIHHLGMEDAKIEIEDNKFERIIVKPTFDKF